MNVIRLLFFGLMAFVPSEDGRTAVVVDAPGHEAWLIQVEGRCEGNHCVYGDQAKQKAEVLRRLLGCGPNCGLLVWNLAGLDVDLLNDQMQPLAVSAGRIGEEPYPRNSVEARDFSWIPSIDRMVAGKATIKKACLDKPAHPKVASRVHLQGGNLSTCHFLHDQAPDPTADDCKDFDSRATTAPVRVPFFDFKRYQQAVGNVVAAESSFEYQTDIARCPLQSADAAETVCPDDELVQATLKPSSEGDVTLVVMNEPTEGTVSELQQLSHFDQFYGLLSFFGSNMNHLPSRTEYVAEIPPGDCESYVRCTHYLLSGRGWFAGFPHGGSECEAATIP